MVGGFGTAPDRMTLARHTATGTEVEQTYRITGTDAARPQRCIASCTPGSRLHRRTAAGDRHILDLAAIDK